METKNFTKLKSNCSINLKKLFVLINFMATYIATGGAGFIGSTLADKLLSMGHRVVVVDNFHSYYNRSIKERNISHNLNNPNYVFVELDICNRDEFKKIVDKFNPEGIFHIAAIAGVRYSVNILKYI